MQEEIRFSFVREGLSELKRAFRQIEKDLGGVESAAASAESQVTSSMEEMTKSTSQLNAQLEQAKQKLSSLDGSAANITISQEQQNSSGGGGGGIIGSLATAGSIGLTGFRLTQEIGDLREMVALATDAKAAFESGTSAVEDFVRGFEKATSAPGRVADGLDEAEDGMQRLGHRAQKTREDLADVLDQMKDMDISVGWPGGSDDDYGGAVGYGERPGGPRQRYEDGYATDRERFEAFGEEGLSMSQNDFFENLGKQAGDAKQQVQDFADQASDALESFGAAGEMVGEKYGEFTDRLGGAAETMEQITGLSPGATAAVAAIGTASVVAYRKLAQLTIEMSRYAEQLQTAQAQSGLAADGIQKVYLQAERLDSSVDLDTVRDGMKELALRTTEAIETGGEAAEGFRRLGISMDRLEQISGDTGAIFRLVQKRMRGLTRQQKALTLEQTFGGEAGEKFARVMNLSAAEAKALRSEIDDLVLSSQELEVLAGVSEEVTALRQEWRALKQEIAVGFADETTGGVASLKDLVSVLQDLVELSNKGPDLGNPFGLGTILKKQKQMNDAYRALWKMISGESPSESLGLEEESAPTGQSMTDAQQRAKKALASAKDSARDLRDDFSRGLIDEEAFAKKLVKIRRSYFEAIRDLDQATTEVDLSGPVDVMAKRLKDAKARLASFNTEAERSAKSIPSPASDMTTQDVLIGQEAPSFDQELRLFEDIKARLEQIRRTPFLPQSEKAERKVSAVTRRIEELQDAGALMSETALRGFLEDIGLSEKMIQKVIDKLEGAGDAAASAGERMEREMVGAIASSADRAFNEFGSALTGSIFGGGGPSVASAQLDLFNAKGQMRSLRDSLAQGRMSYKEFSLRIQTAQRRIQKQQEKLNSAMAGGFVSALEDMGDAAKKIFRQLIADITATVAKMAVLKAITSIFSIGSGGFMGSVVSSMGGGGFLNKAAPAPAPTGVTVNVTGQTSTAGRDLVTSFNTTQQDKRRLKGPKSPR